MSPIVYLLFQLSTDDLKKIVEQNPSLESVAVHVSGLEDPHELKRELKLVNHRIRKLVDLVSAKDYI